MCIPWLEISSLILSASCAMWTCRNLRKAHEAEARTQIAMIQVRGLYTHESPDADGRCDPSQRG